MLMGEHHEKEEEMIYGTHRTSKHDRSTARTFIDLNDVVVESVEQLKPHADKFEHIIVTGVSGIVVGSPVALALGKNLLVVRKLTDDAHDRDTRLLGAKTIYEGDRALFLDDFVSSGETRRSCKRALDGVEVSARIVAQYEYSDIHYREIELADDEA